MKSFKQYITEQESTTISPADRKVITAFLNDTPDIVGDTIKTAKSELRDFTKNDIRIDLLVGRAREGLALVQNGIITLANPGKMIDKNNMVYAVQDNIRLQAKKTDRRVMGN